MKMTIINLRGSIVPCLVSTPSICADRSTKVKLVFVDGLLSCDVSADGIHRLPAAEADLLTIPVQPISYEDAGVLMALVAFTF